MIFVQLYLAGGAALFSRDFWIDEVFTYRIASDPDFLHSMRAVQAGIDLTPPGYQVLVRGWSLVFGLSETSLRSLAFASMMISLAGLYALLRLSASRLICCAAVLLVWSHPLIIEQAFDARFYAPWLAAVIWFCYFWQLGMRREGSYSAYVGLAVCSFLTCSFHYFGVFSLLLIIAGELLLNRPTRRKALPLLLASLSGPLALLVYVPLFYVHQAHISDTTWIAPVSLVSVSRFVLKLLLPRQLAAVVIVAMLAVWLRRDGSQSPSDATRSGIDSSTGLISTILMIPLLIVVSLVMRPVILAKYAIPVVALLGPATLSTPCAVRHRAAAIFVIAVVTISGQ